MTATATARYGAWPGSTPEWQVPGGPTPGPGRPERRPAVSEAGVAPWLEQRMFEQQLVAVSGPVTAELASRVGSQLMTLDALAGPRGGRITMQVSSVDGDLSAAFALMDVLDLMRTPVRAVALGTVGGAALGVYAAATERVAYPHARFVVSEPRVDRLAGTADQVTLAAGAHLRLLEDLAVRLAERTGRTRAQIERELSDRHEMSATEAVEYGLVERLTSDDSGPAR
ncbi:ATP-dependent Clp protease proteolytic subunit [Actinocatenispora rupis]|uniref:ATP-dependent Clp protease proteolytic subunit n=1 Tax=Actinocatenispora rupis TaxID=519421 RepID=A0A8J3J251_9ACTN|nr:ATP-dependent Clp protease proteolytic subunit [Actinocatenispora rupis]GID13155.1 ATP-dependent Clp protease proteolytic subunit [Actinocatenispora rupis]